MEVDGRVQESQTPRPSYAGLVNCHAVSLDRGLIISVCLVSSGLGSGARSGSP